MPSSPIKNTMTDQVNEFLLGAALEGRSYPELAAELKVERKYLTQWEAENKDRYKHLAKVRQVYLRKEFSTITPRQFLKWCEETPRVCKYCKITEEDIALLIEHNQIRTKRLGTRGKSLEIERREPNEKYDNIDNLTYCCYWCNNAKTDEFTEAEFIYIGQLIGTNWNNRLRAIREKKNP